MNARRGEQLRGQHDGTVERKAYIYFLEDPRDGRCRYVGKTVDPRARLYGHRHCTGNTLKDVWLRELRQAGHEPIMWLLDVLPESESPAQERIWIVRARTIDSGILNTTDGGELGAGILRWTDERIRAGIQDWINIHGAFPTQRELRAAGQHALRGAISAYGGFPHWAQKVGCVPVDRSWDDERIRAEIEVWISTHTAFPTSRALHASGRFDLANGVARNGGFSRWRLLFAHELSRVEWTDEMVGAALQAWVSEWGNFPLQRELQETHGALSGAVARSGGYRHWARVLGFQPRTTEWDAARVRAELDDWISANGSFPTWLELRVAGRCDLQQAMAKRGGLLHWAQQISGAEST